MTKIYLSEAWKLFLRTIPKEFPSNLSSNFILVFGPYTDSHVTSGLKKAWKNGTKSRD